MTRRQRHPEHSATLPDSRPATTRSRIVKVVTAAVLGLAGSLATGAAAIAVPPYPDLTATGSDGTCRLEIDSPGTFNQGGFKSFVISTTSRNFGCTQQVFYHSNSTQYESHVASPGSPTLWGGLVAIHRMRVCQSGSPGRCSKYLWWDGSLRSS